MPRFGLATLNHSPLHGLPTQWEAHLDAAAGAGFDALAPDVFWLRSLLEEGVSLDRLAAAMRERGLACMELSGVAIGAEAQTEAEVEENLRYARALSAEFVNTRIVEDVDRGLVARLKAAVSAFRERGAPEGGTQMALEFSRGSRLNGLREAIELVGEVDEPGIGVTLDTWHFCLHPDGPDWPTLEAMPIERFANVQLSDGVAYAEGEFGDATMNRRRMPGAGAFDLARCAATLSGHGFDGAVVLEVLNADERSRSLADYARDALDSARAAFPLRA